MNLENVGQASFIVRLRIEKRQPAAGRAVWRGMIEKVPGGERKYFDHLEDLVDFFQKALSEMGISDENGPSTQH